MEKDIFTFAKMDQWAVLAPALVDSMLPKNLQDDKGYTLLHYAAIHGNNDMIKLLVELGNDLELPTFNGSTALHKAATFGQLKAIDTLLELGANLEAKTKNSDTPSFSSRSPLHEAAVEGHADVIKLLLSHGADRLALTDAHQTAEELAQFYQHADAVAAFS